MNPAHKELPRERWRAQDLSHARRQVAAEPLKVTSLRPLRARVPANCDHNTINTRVLKFLQPLTTTGQTQILKLLQPQTTTGQIKLIISVRLEAWARLSPNNVAHNGTAERAEARISINNTP